MRDWLYKYRKSKNLTHEQIANLVGITRSYYGMIESNERTPSIKNAKKIADTLGFDWTLFFK